MGSMLIDQIQAIRTLGNQVGGANLADQTKQRNGGN